MNDYYKKFQLNLAKDYNAMNEVFKSNWSDIDALFLKHERKILSIEQEVKSIPTLINWKVEKVVAYTNAKSKEAILVSKEYTNSSLKEERNRSDERAAQLERTVATNIQNSEKAYRTSLTNSELNSKMISQLPFRISNRSYLHSFQNHLRILI